MEPNWANIHHSFTEDHKKRDKSSDNSKENVLDLKRKKINQYERSSIYTDPMEKCIAERSNEKMYSFGLKVLFSELSKRDGTHIKASIQPSSASSASSYPHRQCMKSIRKVLESCMGRIEPDIRKRPLISRSFSRSQPYSSINHILGRLQVPKHGPSHIWKTSTYTRP